LNKAVLFSILVFPGSGHLFLKKYKKGFSLMIASAIALTVLVYNLLQRAMEIMDKIQSGEIVQIDMLTISEMLSQTDTLQMQISTSVLLILWVFSIVHSYRISRIQSNK
jgi:hypothetical protein